MALFRLISAGPEAGDCTAPYDVKFSRECTVREFVEEVLTKKEWGTIYIDNRFSGISILYRQDEIKGENFSEDILNKTIHKAFAHGGWSLMDYVLDVGINIEVVRNKYADTLKEIAQLENQIKKLQKTANELEKQLEAMEEET